MHYDPAPTATMKLDSYWTDSVPALALEAHDLPAQVDVAIVGGGFTEAIGCPGAGAAQQRGGAGGG